MSNNLHPVFQQALAPFMARGVVNAVRFSDPRDSLQLEADETDVEDDADDEGGICPTCSGSGEGQYEGTTCRSCKGRGEI